uniref:Uncharacterized protein n=1 Tax=Anopheles christyi TaxID=43041 RepID=A0A9I3A6J3_9DIPT
MEWNWAVIQCTFQLLMLCIVSQANADDCIDMDVHMEEVARCCRYEPFYTEEVYEKCNQELAHKVSPHTPDFITCFIECTYREMGYLAEVNNIDITNYAKFLTNFDTAYQTVVIKAISRCSAIKDDIQRDVENATSKCKAFALLFHICVTQLTLQNCPNDRWTSSEICSKVRMHVPPCA